MYFLNLFITFTKNLHLSFTAWYLITEVKRCKSSKSKRSKGKSLMKRVAWHRNRIKWLQILKKSLEQIQSYKDASLLGPKWLICPDKIFFGKKNNIIFMYLLAPFLVQNIKTTLRVNSELWEGTHLLQTMIFPEKALI